MRHPRHLDDPVVIVHGPRIETLTQSSPEAIAACAGRIVAMGSLALLQSTYRGADVRHLEGALLVPGFNDAHLHPLFAAEPSLRLNLGPEAIDGRDHAMRLLGDRARDTPAGQWIVGAGYDVLHQVGGRLDRRTLDLVSTDHPIYIIGSTWHAAITNTPALELIRAQSDPGESGGTFATDDDGELDGWLYELPHMKVVWSGGDEPALLPQLPPPVLADALAEQNTYLNAHGITSYTDALVTPQTWRAYNTLREQNRMTARASMALWHTYSGVLDQLPLTAGFGDEWLRFVGVKLMYDGAITGGTCLCSEPYKSTTGADNGIKIMSFDDLLGIVDGLHRRGIRACIHANGDAAISDALDAIERVQARTPSVTLNHRIEHCSITDDQLIRRVAAAGVIPVPFAAFVYYHGDQIVDTYSHQRASRVARHGAMLDAGITVAGSSDWPCGPVDVLRGLHSLTTRTTATGQVVGPDERLTLQDALWVYTAGSAAATGESHIKGRLAVGQLADFTVLSEDIFSSGPSWIDSAKVLSTWVAGVEVWSHGAR